MSAGKNGPYFPRLQEPLAPVSGVVVISGDSIQKLPPSCLTSSRVGRKALGLASLPPVWCKPFFVVSGHTNPSPTAIASVISQFKLDGTNEVLVRSSGIDESIRSRGSYESKACSPFSIAKTINHLQERRNSSRADTRRSHIHWIVQQHINTAAKGHLSNERRLFKADRDWLAEIETTQAHPYESHTIAIRPWRDARRPMPEVLSCPYKENYITCLKEVARWAFSRKLRIHFEWVWDGTTVYIVQADEAVDEQYGVDPRKIVVTPSKAIASFNLRAFRRATNADFEQFPKLANTKIYRDLGYDLPDFYILSNESDICELTTSGVLSPNAIEDLDHLTRSPLVIRTDGQRIPIDQRTMLPRSDELRSKEAALKWLTEEFRTKVDDLGLQHLPLALIAHNFVPAVSSAWCLADAEKRRVRIESLWGIPEGIYWYAHDVFDVDTLERNVTDTKPRRKFIINKRVRYKSQFIAPDSSGNWVLYETKPGPDWIPSIRLTRWVEEIAWTSRRISKVAGYPVVVMWFIGVPKECSQQRIMPWYHEQWKPDESKTKAAPRHKSAVGTGYTISTRADWERLKRLCQSENRITRVRVSPTEPDLVRDQKFASQLGRLAKENEFVVNLSGGILSHSYYLLKKEGCAVECEDLFGTTDELLDFNKLVRDNIPNVISTHGEEVEVVELAGTALIESLKRKIVEEAFEILDARNTEELSEEIADLYEVIDKLTYELGIDKKRITSLQKTKAGKKGGFSKGLLLRKTTLEGAFSNAPNEPNLKLEYPATDSIRSISSFQDLSQVHPEINQDIRHDENGIPERQVTITLPMHMQGPLQREICRFENISVFEAVLERVGSRLKIKLRMRSLPVQGTLDLQ